MDSGTSGTPGARADCARRAPAPGTVRFVLRGEAVVVTALDHAWRIKLVRELLQQQCAAEGSDSGIGTLALGSVGTDPDLGQWALTESPRTPGVPGLGSGLPTAAPGRATGTFAARASTGTVDADTATATDPDTSWAPGGGSDSESDSAGAPPPRFAARGFELRFGELVQNTFQLVLGFVRHHATAPHIRFPHDSPATIALENIDPWDVTHLGSLPHEKLFGLVCAADYLQMDDLVLVCCKLIARRIRGKTTEEMRQILHVQSDWTTEELQAARQFNEWATEVRLDID